MRYFSSKSAAAQRGAASAWDFFGDAYKNELKHTGAKSLQNIASGATFGLIPRAKASINPNDRYLSDGMKTTRSVLQGIGEAAGTLAAPMGAMKGVSSAYKAAKGAVGAAGKAAPWYARTTKYLGDKVLAADKWLQAPVLRAARKPGYVKDPNVGFWKALGTQMKNDSLWGNVKTLGHMGRRVGSELLFFEPRYAYKFAQAPTVGKGLMAGGVLGLGLGASDAISTIPAVMERNRIGSDIQSGHLNENQLGLMSDIGISPGMIRHLQGNSPEDWTNNHELREATGLKEGELFEALRELA